MTGIHFTHWKTSREGGGMRALFKDNNGLSQTHDTAPSCAQQAFLGIRGHKSFLKMFKCIRLQQRHWQDLGKYQLATELVCGQIHRGPRSHTCKSCSNSRPEGRHAHLPSTDPPCCLLWEYIGASASAHMASSRVSLQGMLEGPGAAEGRSPYTHLQAMGSLLLLMS